MLPHARNQRAAEVDAHLPVQRLVAVIGVAKSGVRPFCEIYAPLAQLCIAPLGRGACKRMDPACEVVSEVTPVRSANDLMMCDAAATRSVFTLLVMTVPPFSTNQRHETYGA